jgi:hypothetical protein
MPSQSAPGYGPVAPAGAERHKDGLKISLID